MSLFNLSQAYYSETGGAYDNDTGDYVAGGLSAVKIFHGTVQPLTDAEVESLPEGERTKGAVKVYTGTRLAVATKGKVAVKGDLVVFDGRLFEVISSSTYSSGLLPHYKYIGVYRRDI